MSILSPVPSDEIATWYDEAFEARRAGNLDTAQSLLDRILTQAPKHAGALYSHGVLALESNQLESAQRWIERAIEVQPSPVFYNTLYIVQIRLGAFASAEQTVQRGLTLRPDSPMLHFNLGVTLERQGRLEDAAICYRRVLEFEPDNPRAHASLGDLAMALDVLDDAERHLKRAVALTPTDLPTRAALAGTLLTAGRYEEAWPYYEDRWVTGVTADGRPHAVRPQVPLPQWNGETSDTTKRTHKGRVQTARLLVIPEQGYGDSLQFVRYLPMALTRFSKVGYVCPPPLRRLYGQSLCSRWPGLVLLYREQVRERDWDCHSPLMSLPRAFGTRLDSIPATVPYLYADAGRAARWHTRLAALPGSDLPRVGIVWAGGHSGLAVDRERSLTSTQIAPLLALTHVRWISLQKTDDPAKLADPASKARLKDWTDEITDFADTAALIENLDLVISVDTSVAHLAAAMGKPVWLLNRFAGCWRWLRDRDDSPWYPSVRLFTQSQRGNWDDVLARVAAELKQRF
ncbi:tetratricopeptide repeat protein [Paraburkholderia sp. RP-4-7]|uniref:Tetratricopeptide repeat protein n=1 Tax=Paraburkholderia polaris TaxID=2728848 RepID=A0A848IMZ6_9BURK|nr:tetratricopeptide repeat-containing glycosyltransferase family protein [Paraburkholderia polaris]NMM01134.1 tetratricopeptide repeat protein [Paraburkholderia polaris]